MSLNAPVSVESVEHGNGKINWSNWLKKHITRLSKRRIHFIQTTSWNGLQVEVELINGLLRIVNRHS